MKHVISLDIFVMYYFINFFFFDDGRSESQRNNIEQKVM
jgi:hypothetical protein